MPSSIKQLQILFRETFSYAQTIYYDRCRLKTVQNIKKKERLLRNKTPFPRAHESEFGLFDECVCPQIFFF